MRSVEILLGALFFSAVLLSTLPSWVRAKGDGYNYASFKEINEEQALDGLYLRRKIKENIKLFDLEGNEIYLHNLWKNKPLVVEFGSKSCPLFRQGQDEMGRIYSEYKNRVNFATVYVREAHPGLVSPPHRTFEQKIIVASQLKNIEQPVYVDSLQGELHKQFGLGPNSVILIGKDGVVSFFSYWNSHYALRDALENLLDAQGVGQQLEYEFDACQNPAFLSNGQKIISLISIMKAGGPDAFFDFVLNGIKKSGTYTDC